MFTPATVRIVSPLVLACLLLASAPLMAGDIRWTGNATIRYAGGNDVQTAPSLGDPVLTLAAPGSVTVASGFGWNWNLALAQNPKQYIEVKVGALPQLKAETIAINSTALYQQTQRVVFEADFVVSGLGPPGATVTAKPSTSLTTNGRLTNTIGVNDRVYAKALGEYTESAVAGVDQNSTLFTASRFAEYSQTDNGPVTNIAADPWDEEVGWKSDGTYRLKVEIDLRALATGNQAEEMARAAWTGGFTYRQSFLTFVDVVPEPSSIVITLTALTSLGISQLVRRRRG